MSQALAIILASGRPVLALLFAVALSVRGLRKRSLDRSGAAAAFFVGFVAFCASYRFGVVLLLFYQSSSSLTKLGSAAKARLEAEENAQAADRNKLRKELDWVRRQPKARDRLVESAFHPV